MLCSEFFSVSWKKLQLGMRKQRYFGTDCLVRVEFDLPSCGLWRLKQLSSSTHAWRPVQTFSLEISRMVLVYHKLSIFATGGRHDLTYKALPSFIKSESKWISLLFKVPNMTSATFWGSVKLPFSHLCHNYNLFISFR